MIGRLNGTWNTAITVAMLSVLVGGCSSSPSSSSASTSTPTTTATAAATTPNLPTSNSASSTSAPNTGSVSIKQEPISVKTEYFDRGSRMSAQFAAEHNQSANTHWIFHCVPHFRFDILDKNVSDKAATVKLRITNAVVYLSAPVTIYLPKLAKPDVVSHEDGHFKICRKVYDRDARPAAQAAAEKLIGKEFEGAGATLQEASQSALHKAAQEMGREYRSKTIEYLDRVSAYYDQVAPQHPESKYVDACVEAAFKADDAVKAKQLK